MVQYFGKVYSVPLLKVSFRTISIPAENGTNEMHYAPAKATLETKTLYQIKNY